MMGSAAGTVDGVDEEFVVASVKAGTLDDVEGDLRVDGGVVLKAGVGLLEPGARLAMTRRRRSAIRSETDE